MSELSTARLTLRPLDPAHDAADLFEMDADPLVHQYAYGSSSSRSIGQLTRRLAADLRQNGGMTWALRLRGDSTALGTIGIYADQGTTIRGLGWSLRRSHWGQGLTSEAASAVVPFLLAQPGVDGLEAWADSRNIGSLKVAARAGLTERARLPRSYDDHVGQTVVMAIAAEPADPSVFTVTATLQVHDVEATVQLLCGLLGMHVAWMHGDPVGIGEIAVAPWSGSAGIRLQRREGQVQPTEVTFDVGVWVDDIHARVQAAGLVVIDAPGDRPWGRRDFAFALPEGHRISVSGATTPARWQP
jgi:RimJ/RimL family protein N-acetyltransferase/catechol 2,3-dioxygenase-like lactoylglutathione lyase family enzyme